MPTLMETMFVFPMEKRLFFREKASNCYQVAAYYFAKVIVLIPFQIIPPFLNSLLVYFMTDLQRNAGKFFTFGFALVFVTHTASAIAMLISVLVPSFQVALIMSPIYFIANMVLGGFFINYNSIPKYLIWIYYSSPFKYGQFFVHNNYKFRTKTKKTLMKTGFDIMLINEFTGLTLQCLPSELVGGKCPYTSGEQFWPTATDSGASIWRGFVLLASISIACHLLASLFLYRASKKIKA